MRVRHLIYIFHEHLIVRTLCRNESKHGVMLMIRRPRPTLSEFQEQTMFVQDSIETHFLDSMPGFGVPFDKLGGGEGWLHFR